MAYNKFITIALGILISLIASSPIFAQKDLNIIEKVADGLYFMYYDQSESKSTIVEFKDHLALIEVPICDEGGGAVNLRDHREGGDRKSVV